MNRRTFLSCPDPPRPGRTRPAQPNIIWMMADDPRLRRCRLLRQKWIHTPNIDRLATEGLRFTDGYAGCTVCAPSRSVLMTGLHTGHTPIRSNPGGVPLLPSEHTVAETAAQCRLCHGPVRQVGPGRYRHHRRALEARLRRVLRLPAPGSRPTSQYPRFLYSNEREYPLKGNDKPGRQTYANDVMHEKSLDFLRRRKGGPFFLYTSFTMPHSEPHVPDDSIAPYRGKIPNGPLYHQANGRLKDPARTGPRLCRHGLARGPLRGQHHAPAEGTGPGARHPGLLPPATTAA